MANNQPDIEQDSVPSAEQWNAPQPKLIDVAVICTKKDYKEVTKEFIPWLKGIARKFELDGVDGVRIHLYNDPNVTPEHNVFSQTVSVAKCMKILVFITENFMKDELLKGVLQELIMMTRFITEEQVKEYVSKICSKRHVPEVYVKYLSECVQRQKKNAIIPVQAQERKINFVGLISIIELHYYDKKEHPEFAENSAKNVLKLAIEERKKLQKTLPGHKHRSNRSSEGHPNTSSREYPQGTQYEPQNTTSRQVISNECLHQNRGHPQRNRYLQNQSGDADDSSANYNSPCMESLVSSNQSETNNNQATATDTENNDIRAPNTGSSQAPSSCMNGNEQRNSVESGLGIDESLGSASNNMSEVSTSSENHPRSVTSGEIKTPVHGGPALTSDQATENSRPDLEEDQLESGQASNTADTKTVLTESGQASNTEIKTVLTESGYGSLPGQGQMKQNDGATPVTELSNETSLENTSLVNDCGDAALGKYPDSTNLNTSSEESMPSVDAQKVDGESYCMEDNEVLEHTNSSYTDMPEQPVQGLMAGSVSQNDKRYSPDGSDVPDSTSHLKGDDLSSLDVNRSRQFEVENIPDPSLSDESLASSGAITTLTQQSDVREPGGAAEGQGQGHTTPHICFIEGPQLESELQTNSLFVSTLDQRFIHKRTTKTNTLSMMSKNVIFLQEGRTEHHYEYDEVD